MNLLPWARVIEAWLPDFHAVPDGAQPDQRQPPQGRAEGGALVVTGAGDLHQPVDLAAEASAEPGVKAQCDPGIVQNIVDQLKAVGEGAKGRQLQPRARGTATGSG